MDKVNGDFWSRRKSLRNGVAGAVAILLTDYFRIQLHKWLGISIPLAAALGFVISWTLAWFYGNGFGWTKRTYALILLIGAAAIYVVGRFN